MIKKMDTGEVIYPGSVVTLDDLKDGIVIEEEDVINHPSHYTDGKIEVWDYIKDKNLNYFLGNAVKYISRAGKKEHDKYVQDLKKAIAYLNKEIENVTKKD